MLTEMIAFNIKNNFERLFVVLSFGVLIYFVLSTFGFLGEVKDRANYEMTFDNMNAFESFWGVFFGSSILYGLFLLFGASAIALSIYSMIFLVLKIVLIKRIFKSWIFIFIYLIKFAFVVDMILLKESLALVMALLAIVSLSAMRRYFFLMLAFYAHISVVTLILIALKKGNDFNIFAIFLMVSIVYLLTLKGDFDFAYFYYFIVKYDSYEVELNDNKSFVIGNPIFWTGAILAACSVYERKYDIRVLFTQLISIFAGFMHPIIGVPAFRFWQFSSFVDLFSLSYLSSRFLIILYTVPNFIFFIYAAVYQRNFLNI
jgi:hypothetical protein